TNGSPFYRSFFVQAEMAAIGQELMLCKADDLDLIKGNASPQRQLQFLEQLCYVISGFRKSAGQRTGVEMLLSEVFAAENLPHLREMLQPALDPWPAHIEYQQMMTFSHLYETDLRVYCSRDVPSFSTETDIFQRVHQKLLACNTVITSS
ncbi:hypothetical protein GOODEAATRI_026209, partial [Goodea atripinnis]